MKSQTKINEDKLKSSPLPFNNGIENLLPWIAIAVNQNTYFLIKGKEGALVGTFHPERGKCLQYTV